MKTEVCLAGRYVLLVIGGVIAFGGVLLPASATGNGGVCRMADTAGNWGTEEEPDWRSSGSECIGDCDPGDCLEYNTNLTTTIDGVVHEIWDCGCGQVNQSGVVEITQADVWTYDPPAGPTPCRTVALQSTATSTPEYEATACYEYTCEGTCNLHVVAGEPPFPWVYE